MPEFNFIVLNNPYNTKEDFDLMFGENAMIVGIVKEQDFIDVLVISGIYETRSKAKKDGWEPEMPIGFFDKKIGKKRTRITIWNPTG